MKKKRVLYLIIAVLMLLSAVVFTSCTAENNPDEQVTETEPKEEVSDTMSVGDASGFFEAPKKEELVYVKADASGSIQSVTDSVSLSGYDIDTGDFVGDKTNLSDIENSTGIEKFIQNNDEIYFENYGETITYEGTGKEEIPMDVEITYYLDGRELSAEEIEGAAGDVTIRFDYTNHTRFGDYVPFYVMTMIVLDPDKFSDISVNNGMVTHMGYNTVAVGYTVPDLLQYLEIEDDQSFGSSFPDYLEFNCKTTNFKIDMTMTTVTNGFTDKISENGSDKINETVDNIEKLTEATKELSVGSAKVLDGVLEFQTYLQTFTDGINELEAGLAELDEATKDLPEYADVFRSLSEVTENLNPLLDFLISIDCFDEWKSAIKTCIEWCDEKGCTEVKQVLEDLLAKVEKLQEIRDKLGEEKINEFRKILQSDKHILVVLADYIDQFTNGIKKIHEGAVQLKNGSVGLNTGYATIAEGIKALNSGIKQFNSDGMAALLEEKEDLTLFNEKLIAMKQSDEQYNTYSGHFDNTECSVIYIIQSENIGDTSGVIL